MKDVLIHIGYHKTASSWLQSELFVAGSPVFEPLSRQHRYQSTLALDFVIGRDGYLLPPLEINRQVIDQELDYIKQNRPVLKDRIGVLSHERLSGNPHSSGFDAGAIAERLASTFPRAKILIMVREQKSFLLSCYFQYLKAGGTHSLSTYLNTPYDGKRPGFSPHHIAYTPLVEKYRHLFGPDNVLVLPYELFIRQPQEIIDSLSQFLKYPLEVSPVAFDRRVNQLESPYLNWKLRRLNQYLTSSSLNDHSRAHSHFAKRCAGLITTLFQPLASTKRDDHLLHEMRRYIAHWCSGRYAQSNRALVELTELNLETYGYDVGPSLSHD